MPPPPTKRPPKRVLVALAAVVLALFAAGMIYGAVKGEDRPCGDEQPLKSRPGMLGQTQYLCPDGRTVID